MLTVKPALNGLVLCVAVVQLQDACAAGPAPVGSPLVSQSLTWKLFSGSEMLQDLPRPVAGQGLPCCSDRPPRVLLHPAGDTSEVQSSGSAVGSYREAGLRGDGTGRDGDDCHLPKGRSLEVMGGAWNWPAGTSFIG